ncbi:MAG: hypothetical protein AAB425_07940, partial [Bdellovibrionota bacterium]
LIPFPVLPCTLLGCQRRLSRIALATLDYESLQIYRPVSAETGARKVLEDAENSAPGTRIIESPQLV